MGILFQSLVLILLDAAHERAQRHQQGSLQSPAVSLVADVDSVSHQVLSKGQEKHHKAAIALRRNQVRLSRLFCTVVLILFWHRLSLLKALSSHPGKLSGPMAQCSTGAAYLSCDSISLPASSSPLFFFRFRRKEE
jgi:hypothetical protein